MGLSKKTKNKLFTYGYATKGLIYLLIGGFAVATVAGSGSINGPKEVIQWIGTNPFGNILLGIVGIGLAFYAVWRMYSAISPPPGKDEDGVKGTVKRIGWFVSGISHALLAFFVFRLLFMSGGSGSGDTKQDMVAKLLEQPWGQWLVGIVGVIVAGVGLYQLYRGVTDKHMEPVEDGQLSEEQEEAFRNSGRIGLASRAIVFGIISYFLFKAAMMNDASQFKGISGALETIQDGSYGAVLLALTGVGLFAYGLFMWVRARYETV